jgi:hypothetical protein
MRDAFRIANFGFGLFSEMCGWLSGPQADLGSIACCQGLHPGEAPGSNKLQLHCFPHKEVALEP